MAAAKHIPAKTIVALNDRQVFTLNRDTNRKMHPTPAPKGYLPADADDNGKRDNEWTLRGTKLVNYADYYAQFLLGNRSFPGQPSKFGLTPQQADKVRDHVRDRLMGAAKVNAVLPLNNDDVTKLVEKYTKEWDAFANKAA